MKSLRHILLFFLILLICKNVFADRDTISISSKPGISLFVDYCSFGISAKSGKIDAWASVFVVNNSDDTLSFLTSGGLKLHKFFLSDQPEMQLVDHFCMKNDSIVPVIIPSRQYRTFRLEFNLTTLADTNFTFKIGMHLIKIPKRISEPVDWSKVPEQKTIIWSDEQKYQTDADLGRLFSPQHYRENMLKRPLPNFIPLTAGDRENLHLSIDQVNISPLRQTVFGGTKCFITDCLLTLTNNSNTTLKYMSMDASWWQIYTVDNKNFELGADPWDVFKNEPVVLELPPHKSVTRRVPILTLKDSFRGEKLRIAMSVQQPWSDFYSSRLPFFDDLASFDPDEYMLRPVTQNLIWSNEVTIN